MRAFNLAMVMIFINCGFAVAASMGVFGNIFNPETALEGGLFSFLRWELSFNVLGFAIAINGVHAIMIALITGSFLVLNSNIGPSSSGYAYGIFTVIFWFGILSTDSILVNTIGHYAGVGIFLTIYNLAAMLIFINALIQMPTGGQRSHV